MIRENSSGIAFILVNRIFDLTDRFLLISLLFFCTTNELVSFPLDKLVMFLVISIILVVYPESKILSAKEFFLLVLIGGIASISSIVNIIFSPMIFFPVAGLLFSMIMSRFPKIILYSLYYALLIHMILAILFLILAYTGVKNHYVYSLLGKGFGLYAERGFTATVQTFGTLCLTWLLLYFLRRELRMNSFVDKVFFYINCIAILGTLNRSTYLFWMIIIFFKERKLFITILIVLGLFLIKFWKEIIAFVTVSSSLTARIELLQGFNLSFVQSHSFLVYIFGKGTNELSPDIIAKVKWSSLTNIENGYAMLLHTYGSVGLLFYISVGILFILMFIKINKWAEGCILFYFFFIAPYFTHEFVSVTFYLFLSVMFLNYNLSTSKLKNKLVSP